MRKIFSLLIVIVSISVSLNGQVVDHDPVMPAGWMKGATINLEQPGINGSIYLFDNWLEGTLVMKNGRVVDDIKINFAGENGDLVISRPYQGIPTEYQVIERDVTSVTTLALPGIPKRHFVNLPIDSIEAEGTGGFFYELLLDDKAALLKKTYKQFVRAKQTEAYANGANDAKYVLRTEYYIRPAGSSDFRAIRLNKKLISGALGASQSSKAKGLMKKNKWKWNKDEDIVQLLQALSN
ncbi:MAG: hypothetical protein HEP71_06445 [Roseivirga sp.]|nr:hypothetical protein [Roseivirga sp.]